MDRKHYGSFPHGRIPSGPGLDDNFSCDAAAEIIAPSMFSELIMLPIARQRDIGSSLSHLVVGNTFVTENIRKFLSEKLADFLGIRGNFTVKDHS